MIARLGLLRRKEGLGPAEFRDYWRATHGPLAARIPGLRRYEQHHVVAADAPAGADAIDGLSQLWFDDAAAMERAMAAEASVEAGQDHPRFIGSFRLLLVEPNVVVPVPAGRPLVKRMSLLRRRAGVNPDEFRREWHGLHATLVERLHLVRGYTQNLVVGRSVARGLPASYDELPVDGVVELWFDDLASMEATFASPAGKTLRAHSDEFIDGITGFRVESHRLV